MALHKKAISGATFKERTKRLPEVWPPNELTINRSRSTAFATLQEPSVDTQPSQQHEDQLFQMLLKEADEGTTTEIRSRTGVDDT